jgi:hypothetical protein
MKAFGALALVTFLVAFIGCASIPFLGGAGTVDEAAVQADLFRLAQEGVVFGFCPDDLRTVAIVNGSLTLGCAGSAIGEFSCPSGQVMVGLKVTGPGSENQVDPVCIPAEAAPAPGVENAPEVPADLNP